MPGWTRWTHDAISRRVHVVNASVNEDKRRRDGSSSGPKSTEHSRANRLTT